MQERLQNTFSLKLNPKKYPWKNTDPHKNITIPFSHALKNTHPRQLTFQKNPTKTHSNLHVLFPFCVILRCIFTSGILRPRLLIQIWIHSAEACILAMSCLGYMVAWLKTFSSLSKRSCLPNPECNQVGPRKKGLYPPLFLTMMFVL